MGGEELDRWWWGSKIRKAVAAGESIRLKCGEI